MVSLRVLLASMFKYLTTSEKFLPFEINRSKSMFTGRAAQQAGQKPWFFSGMMWAVVLVCLQDSRSFCVSGHRPGIQIQGPAGQGAGGRGQGAARVVLAPPSTHRAAQGVMLTHQQTPEQEALRLKRWSCTCSSKLQYVFN